jgi:hypothetical protein
MRSSIRKLGIISGAALGLWALALVGAPNTAVAQPATSRDQTSHESVVVTAIDRTTRSATLQNADGDTKTVNVPQEVKAFDTLKVGDHIDIDYYESIAVSVLPPGTKPTSTQSSSMNRTGQGAAMGTRETSVSATIISVDARNEKITFKGPRGNVRTVSVSDPEMQRKLPSLKAGQVVQLTYTEAIAASIRPTSPASSKWQP